MLVCFIGIDGSGKTTQSKALAKALADMGIKSKYIYNRFAPFLSKPFLIVGKLLFFRGKGKLENYTEYSVAMKGVFRNRLLSTAYQYFLLFDYSLQSLMRLSLPLILGQCIICDRYIQDTVMDIAIDLNHSKEKLSATLRSFLRFLPKPDLIFLIDVPEEIAYQRKSDIPSINFLKERRQVYLDIGREYKMAVLDGSQDEAKITAIIQSKLGKVMNWSSHLMESPTITLIKTIGSPLMPNRGRLLTDDSESLELYKLAVRNKIPLLYLEALDRQGKLNRLKSKYDEEKAKYLKFTDGISRVAQTLNAASVKYAIFKTIKPYPSVPVDIDLLILGNNDMYKRAVEVLLRAGYLPQTPDIVNMADLTGEKAYERAAELLTKPTYGKKHVSPTGTDLLDPEYGIDIDLQKDIAVSYIVYLDKNKFKNHIIRTKLGSEPQVSTFTPQFDLMSVIAHSLMEQLYLLGEYYAYLYRLAAMDEPDIGDFIDAIKENRLEAATRSFTVITAELHRAAHGTIPQKLELILDKLGSDTSEAISLVRGVFKTPHRYRVLTIAKVFWEKKGEKRFRQSLATQVIKTLNPSLGRLVIRELWDKRHRQTYLEEVEARKER